MLQSLPDLDAAPMSPPSPPRAAIVTAYYKEERHLLERCLASVRAQSVAADHIVVADGFPQDWLDQAGVRHIKLDRSHGDYGGAPRGVGSLLAIAEDYDAICFLDADNWLMPDHLRLCFETAFASEPRCDYVIARRNMMRPDETILPVADEPIEKHVDTNCFFFLPGAFHVVPHFALIPRPLSSVGDRLFYALLRRQNLIAAALPRPTVNYHCLWAALYRAAGEHPPPDAKASIDQMPLVHWLNGLSPLERATVSRRTGFVI